MDRPRTRLPPPVRIGQILDAALREFSRAGYSGTRMDDIALCAGVSKGGLYAHFASKEAIFEALLERHLAPAPLDIPAIVDSAASVQALAERIADHLHESLAKPAMISTLRLLLAESGRVPHLAARWRHETAEAHLADLGRLLALARRRGLCRDGVALREPWLLLAPVVHTVVMAALLGPDDELGLAARREAHVAMIVELLAPAARQRRAARSS
ncbi:TetR/AcrR family transcriptional regulator [Achromobacter sp. JD417]|uniref:TetR/AcrR family transcriptional regulator n=1 Tax=Achromobacter sp. JD417 TaxID=2893881 RepID=UPI0035A6BEDE